MTGGAGFIGSHIVEGFSLNQGANVTIYDNFSKWINGQLLKHLSGGNNYN